MSILWREKNSREREHPCRRSLNIPGIIWGGIPFSRTTHSQWRLGLRSSLRGRGCSWEGHTGPVLWRSAARGLRLTQETPLCCAGSVFRIDFSCMPVAPEVLRAIRELFHPSQPTHLLPAWASPALDPWMEVWATGEEEEDESPWQWWWAAPGLWVQSSTSLYPAFQPPTLVSIWKRENRVFFKISPLAFSIPLLNANANVNTNTLIKNMWEENANLLFCNLPQGTRCYTATNTNAQYETDKSTSLYI